MGGENRLALRALGEIIEVRDEHQIGERDVLAGLDGLDFERVCSGVVDESDGKRGGAARQLREEKRERRGVAEKTHAASGFDRRGCANEIPVPEASPPPDAGAVRSLALVARSGQPESHT